VIDPGRLRAVLGETREALDAAAGRAGRPPGSVALVLAGKYVPPEDAPALVAAGVEVVGENRLQDLRAKRAVAPGLVFDFIGHLQRRKVKDVLPAVRLLHSLDSVPLAVEESKAGILPAQLRAFVDDASAHPELVFGGLMAMPPAHTDPEHSRAHFAALRTAGEALASEWAGRHDFRDLSMGTSQDHLVAAEEGATMVRVGRGILERAKEG
jgi:PLP dependent protein